MPVREAPAPQSAVRVNPEGVGRDDHCSADFSDVCGDTQAPTVQMNTLQSAAFAVLRCHDRRTQYIDV